MWAGASTRPSRPTGRGRSPPARRSPPSGPIGRCRQSSPRGRTRRPGTWLGIDNGRTLPADNIIQTGTAQQTRGRCHRPTTPGTSSTQLHRCLIGRSFPGRPDGCRGHPELREPVGPSTSKTSACRETSRAIPVTYDGARRDGRVDRGAARRLRVDRSPTLGQLRIGRRSPDLGLDRGRARSASSPRRHGRPGRQRHRLHLGHHRGPVRSPSPTSPSPR